MGDLDREFVRDGNNIATATAFLLLVAHMRGVRCVLENPPSSRIWRFPIVKEVLEFLPEFKWSAIVHRCGYSAVGFGQ